MRCAVSSWSWCAKPHLDPQPVPAADFRAQQQTYALFVECTECKIGAARGTGTEHGEGNKHDPELLCKLCTVAALHRVLADT